MTASGRYERIASARRFAARLQDSWGLPRISAQHNALRPNFTRGLHADEVHTRGDRAARASRPVPAHVARAGAVRAIDESRHGRPATSNTSTCTRELRTRSSAAALVATTDARGRRGSENAARDDSRRWHARRRPWRRALERPRCAWPHGRRGCVLIRMQAR